MGKPLYFQYYSFKEKSFKNTLKENTKYSHKYSSKVNTSI